MAIVINYISKNIHASVLSLYRFNGTFVNLQVHKIYGLDIRTMCRVFVLEAIGLRVTSRNSAQWNCVNIIRYSFT